MTEKARDLGHLPHPLAPVGAPSLAEERAAHERKLMEQDDVTALERRQDRMLRQIDSIFEMISDQVLPGIARTELLIADTVREQAVTTTAVNRLADRVDTMGKAIRELDARVVGLEVLDGRVTALEHQVAELVQPKPAKRKRVKVKTPKRKARR